MKMLFSINVLLGSFVTMVSSRTILDNMSPKEIKQFFGTPDGIIPKYHLVTFAEPSRMKRSHRYDVPKKLIINTTLFNTTLDIVRDNYLIGPGNTAILYAMSNRKASHNVSYEADPGLMEKLGDFSFYQNTEEGSALTYFHQFRTFTGVLRGNWTLKRLPEGALEGIVIPTDSHAIKIRSVSSEEDKIEQFEEFGPLHALFYSGKTADNHLRRRKNTKMAKQIHNREKRFEIAKPPRRWPVVAFPKLLLTVDYGLLMHYDNIDFLQYLISFVNVVDMTFRRIDDVTIRITIAGIIISEDSGATPYIARDTSEVDELNADDVLERTSQNFYEDHGRFPADRYDVVMVMTEKPLFQLGENKDRELLTGLSMFGSACYWSEKAELLNKTPTAGAGIFTYDLNFGGVSTMAHQLGHILGAKHDSECPKDEHFIMDPVSPGNLKWSNCSTEGFRNFLSSEDGSCLRIPAKQVSPELRDKKGAWLSSMAMCDNMFHDSPGPCLLQKGHDICSGLGCVVKGKCVNPGRKPWDGAYCGTGKTCQNAKCV